MLVVSDTSPLRPLSVIGHLDLIRSIYGRALVPPAVVSELSVPVAHLPPIVIADYPYMDVRSPTDTRKASELRRTLGPGESEAIALALEVGAQAILIDEYRGRSMAAKLGLRPVGVLAVLANAKGLGYIDAVAPLVDDLKARISFRIHPDILAQILRLAGEA